MIENKDNPSVCCGILEKMDIRWMHNGNGVKLMPYIENGEFEPVNAQYRVNFCPSCGADVRECKIKIFIKTKK